jgi:hypothetical protein
MAEATEHLAASLAAFDGLGNRYEVARTQMQLAMTGVPDVAAWLDRAEVTLGELGAQADLAQLHRIRKNLMGSGHR